MDIRGQIQIEIADMEEGTSGEWQQMRGQFDTGSWKDLSGRPLQVGSRSSPKTFG